MLLQQRKPGCYWTPNFSSFFFTLRSRDGMFGDGGIPLTHVARTGEDATHPGHPFFTQIMPRLELTKKDTVLPGMGFDIPARGFPGQDTQANDELKCNKTMLHGLAFLTR